MKKGYFVDQEEIISLLLKIKELSCKLSEIAWSNNLFVLAEDADHISYIVGNKIKDVEQGNLRKR